MISKCFDFLIKKLGSEPRQPPEAEFSMLSGEKRRWLDSFASQHFGYFNYLNGILSKYIGHLDARSLLDIGCGSMFPQLLLFNTMGCSRAIGVDITDFVDLNNLEPEWKYFYAKLQELTGCPLRHDGVDARSIDITKTPFPDDFFDIIISNNVFEHISNLDEVMTEINRISKSNAIFCIAIHSWTHLSGSHHPQVKFPVTEFPIDVKPWYHLTEAKNQSFGDLNKWRIKQYRDLFERHSEILEWRLRFEEGKQFLTDEIRNELEDYTEEELLMRTIEVVARPQKKLT